MNNNYQGTVFFDLDGTLLNNDSQVDDSVAKAVHQLKANNYLPVISTGRSPIEIDAATKTTGIDTYITLNGAFVQSQGNVIYQNNIKPTLIKAVINQAKEFGDSISMHSPTESFLSEASDFVKDFYQAVNIELPKVDPTFYQKKDVQMVVVVSSGDAKRYQEKFPELKFYKTGPYSIDTIDKGVSKMNGIKHLIKGLHLEDKPVYAFGDGPNDLPMIESADYSIAMGNGIESVKNAATYVTTENVNGGIVKGLKHFNLI
ncbi:Cof-type HAD-IIB family hydrolase [Companilactobacillus halodurans]|uniref:Cof-type HAD-IIB family hydrolase n=1 Tax=Companilactobacillus halodurans TaxID=2584183 RepID=A0A5P0ZQG6_9LACO|nr:Cof-type HAD-IIB family hydrolase [Companilactobacillus halodurans]MQS76448.1 Cof-type HAD-IIB family hydrolase [Companilactobacillus halodurans]MQS97531.1 Cof-type HAD-IIB family hydrolase [Companilactobacillus halodurans]